MAAASDGQSHRRRAATASDWTGRDAGEPSSTTHRLLHMVLVGPILREMSPLVVRRMLQRRHVQEAERPGEVGGGERIRRDSETQ